MHSLSRPAVSLALAALALAILTMHASLSGRLSFSARLAKTASRVGNSTLLAPRPRSLAAMASKDGASLGKDTPDTVWKELLNAQEVRAGPLAGPNWPR